MLLRNNPYTQIFKPYSTANVLMNIVITNNPAITLPHSIRKSILQYV